VNEYWLAMSEVPDGDFFGDCEDFAMAVLKKLHQHRINGNLVFVRVGDGTYHIVVAVGNWILDNRRNSPVLKNKLDYEYISMLMNDGMWRKIE